MSKIRIIGINPRTKDHRIFFVNNYKIKCPDFFDLVLIQFPALPPMFLKKKYSKMSVLCFFW